MIKLVDVYKEYENGTVALDGVNLQIDDGEFVFLVGPSGSGKSTVLKLITGEEQSTHGRVMVNGYNMNNIRRWQIPYMRRTLGVIFQDFRLIEKKTVRQNLEFAMRVVGTPGSKIRKRVPAILNTVGLGDKLNRLPNELSGGEQQRVALARALANNPKIIIADEPTGNIDPEMSIEIMNLLLKINRLGKTVIVVTHEKSLVDYYQQRVVTIEHGKVTEDKVGGMFE